MDHKLPYYETYDYLVHYLNSVNDQYNKLLVGCQNAVQEKHFDQDTNFLHIVGTDPHSCYLFEENPIACYKYTDYYQL